MWEIAIDKWTRNWNFYREKLTNSILEKFNMNNKRQKRQTKVDFVELTGQNIKGSATGPQDIFIEHYDCDAEETTNVKYYELNKISTCKIKSLDLDMTKTEVQLISKAQAVEIKHTQSQEQLRKNDVHNTLTILAQTDLAIMSQTQKEQKY